MKILFCLGTVICLMHSTLIQAQGSLDNSFDGDGKVITDAHGTGDYRNSIAIQSDGKIVVGGNSNYDFIVVRYNSDGSPDNSFGAGGMVTTDIASSYDLGNSVVIRPDGRILLAGTTYVAPDEAFALAQYNPDGSLDSTFGTDGTVFTVMEVYDGASVSAAIQADGKVLVTGGVWGSNQSSNFAIIRYHTDGSLDSSFGTNGIIEMDFNSLNNFPQSIVIQPDGKFIVAGNSSAKFVVVRYLPDGSLDSSFSTDGISTADIASGNWGTSVVLQTDGKIVIGGMAAHDFALARFNPDGLLDSTFSSEGTVTISIPTWDIGFSVALQEDGKILLAGYSSVGFYFNQHNDFSLIRFLANGIPDSSFGGAGIITTSMGSNSDDKAYSMAIQPDGKIVLAGFTAETDTTNFYDMAVVRYLPELATGIVDMGSLQQFIYPNPINSNTANLEYELENSQRVAITLLNSNGQLLKTFINQKQQAGKHTESLVLPASLSNGWYAIKIETENGSVLVKVIKQ